MRQPVYSLSYRPASASTTHTLWNLALVTGTGLAPCLIVRFPGLLIALLLGSNAFAQAAQVPPLRQGVDIYNAVGSNARLVAFMKIGASKNDLRYLGFLNAKVSRRALPKAFLAGSAVYLQGLDHPLMVIDLKQRLFSFNGKKVDLKRHASLEQRMAALEKIVYPRSAFILWDWILPRAYALTEDPRALANLAALLAVGGVASSAQCLSEAGDNSCTDQFMGALAAIGTVVGLNAKSAPTGVFCSPDFRGGQKFVVAGDKRNLLSISETHGEFEISPSNLRSDSRSAKKAASELLASCQSPGQLSTLNVALAYPAALPPRAAAAPSAGIAAHSTMHSHRPSQAADRRSPGPASAPVYDTSSANDQGGAAR